MQFQLIADKTNIKEYFELINDKLIDNFEKFKWCINSARLFDQTFLLKALCSQLEAVVHIIHYVLKSVTNFETAELNLKLMAMFYEFMTFFFNR